MQFEPGADVLPNEDADRKAPTVIEEIDRILLKDLPSEAEIDYMIDALVAYQEMRVFIAERIVKIRISVEGKIFKLLLQSDDQDLLVHCSLILMMKGSNVGVTCLLRAVAAAHPLEIVIARHLARRQIKGLADALLLSLERRPSLCFPVFIELVHALWHVDQVSAKRIFEEYVLSNKGIDLRFHDEQIEKITGRNA